MSTGILFVFAVILSFISFCLSVFTQGTCEIPRPLYAIVLFLCFPIFYLISSAVDGVSRFKLLGYSLDVQAVSFIILAYLLMFLVWKLFQKKDRIIYSYIAFFFGVIVCAVIFGVRLVWGTDIFALHMFTSITTTVLGLWSSFAIFFGIATVLFIITLDMLPMQRFVKGIVICVLGVSLFFVGLVHAQPILTLLLCFALTHILYRYIYPHSKSATIKEKFFSMPRSSLIVLAFCVVCLTTSVPTKVSNSLSISNVEVRPSITLTYSLFTHVLQDHPLFGSGSMTFPFTWQKYRPIYINTTQFWNKNFDAGVGLLPTFAVTTGLLGIISLFLFFIVYISLGYRAIRFKTDDHVIRYLVVSSFFISLYLWIVTIIYVPSMVIVILTFFFTGLFFAISGSIGLLPSYTVSLSKNIQNNRIGAGIILCSFVLLGWFGWVFTRTIISVQWYQKSLIAVNQGDASTAITDVITAERFAPYDIYYVLQAEIYRGQILSVLSNNISQTNIPQISQFFATTLSSAVQSGLQATLANKNNYLNWIELGNIYSLAVPSQTKIVGAYESAKAAYLHAQELNPYNPEINLALARLEFANGNVSSATRYVEAAIDQKHDYLDAYFFLSQMEAADNNIPRAIASLDAVLANDPNQPTVYFQLGLLKYDGNDFTGSIMAFKQSLVLAPDYANAKYFLGLAYAKIGDYEDATPLFQDLAASNPDNADVQSILTKLVAGESPFIGTSSTDTNPEKGSNLPVQEKNK